DVMAGIQKDTKGHSYYAGTSEKRVTYLVINELAKSNTTNIIITGESAAEKTSIDGVSEYVCDGMINLKSLTIGETLSRTLEVKKMRCTKIDGGIKSYEFGPGGIKLLG
ncbi:MAG: hypothetical protein KGH62_01270, partial [Candidatus Micrarchaeota archaeon]|nr:hypothetical protein [Candidatus Micrarchaeota archaeon]